MSLATDLQQLFAEGEGDGFRTVGDAEAFEDCGELLLDPDLRLVVLLGDVGVRIVLGDRGQELQLTGRQPVHRVVLFDLLQETGGRLGRENLRTPVTERRKNARDAEPRVDQFAPVAELVDRQRHGKGAAFVLEDHDLITAVGFVGQHVSQVVKELTLERRTGEFGCLNFGIVG